MKVNLKQAAFVFPGQGSQAVGMGRDLVEKYSVARATYDEADSILGFGLSKIMLDGPAEDLNETINTQPALFVHSLAAHRVFTHLFPDGHPAYAAGHSLGELSALTVCGGLTFEGGLRLVRRRGELMKQAGERAPGGMAAILGLDIPTLEGICNTASEEDEIVQVANDNCPGQVVISGARSAVERAIAGAKSAGAKRALPLAVSIAAHSPLMASIQDQWDEAVQAANFMPLQIQVVGNVQAKPLMDIPSAREDLRSQMQSRVRWTESVQFLAAQEINTFIEVGTGSVLGGLVKRIADGAKHLPLGNAQDFESLENL